MILTHNVLKLLLLNIIITACAAPSSCRAVWLHVASCSSMLLHVARCCRAVSGSIHFISLNAFSHINGCVSCSGHCCASSAATSRSSLCLRSADCSIISSQVKPSSGTRNDLYFIARHSFWESSCTCSLQFDAASNTQQMSICRCNTTHCCSW